MMTQPHCLHWLSDELNWDIYSWSDGASAAVYLQHGLQSAEACCTTDYVALGLSKV